MSRTGRSSSPKTTFYAQDTCTLKTNRILLGTIERTHEDVETHTPLDLLDLDEEIERDQISDAQFQKFLRTGVPPPDTVLVTWSFVIQDGSNLAPSLIPCSSLELVDRSVLVGDVVKRKATDAESGVVIHVMTRTELFPTQRWSQTGSATTDASNVNADFNVLMGIPSYELCKPDIYEEEDMIVYKGWVGRIEDVHREVAIRLPNGTVVKVDERDPGLELDERSSGVPSVGDPVVAKKGTLRTGRWVFGQYDANQDPQGLIVEVQALEILVRWLKRRYGPDDLPQPEVLISGDDLENGSILVHDSTAVPKGSDETPIGLEVGVGHNVRFRDLDKAAKKYNKMKPIVGLDHVNQLNKIPRSQTLGYDVNVFLVGRTMTKCAVYWQDTSMSEHHAVDLVLSQAVDDEDEVWPGEVVFRRDPREIGQTTYTPTKAGVVQEVDAESRVATVKWMPNASCSFTVEEGQENLLPGSRTGLAAGEDEQISLYDIQSLHGFGRRLGDFVIISPPQYDIDSCKDGSITPEFRSVLSSDTSEGRWMGEIIHLGLNGLLTVRLGAAKNITDVRVPWECTELAYSNDQEDDEVALTDLMIGSDDSEDEELDDAADPDVGWKDEFDQEVTMDDDWESDDSDQKSEERVLTTATESASNKSSAQGQSVSSNTRTSGNTFSYAGMFQGTDDGSSIESFSILEGAPPTDHHWATKAPSSGEASATAPIARINKEHKILRSSLPPGVYVRTWESSLHLMRVLMLGPIGTPYEYAPFVFDILLDSSFPQQPPQLFFHSWTLNTGPANPNLYENGKVCLSLLGTWQGSEKGESWTSNSTILQVLVSLLGLVLVKQPYYNEAGFEARSGSDDSTIPSAVYSEKAYFKTRSFITHAIKEPPGGLADEVHKLYLSTQPGAPRLLARATASGILVMLTTKNGQRNVLKGLKHGGGDYEWPLDESRTITIGAVIPLSRCVVKFLEILQGVDSSLKDNFGRALMEPMPSDSSIKLLFDTLR